MCFIGHQPAPLHQSMNFSPRQRSCWILNIHPILIDGCLNTHWIFNFDQSQTCWDGNCFCKQTFSIFLPVFVVGKPSTSSQKHNFIPFASFAESLRKLNYISMVVFFHQELSIYTICVAGLRPPRFSFDFLFWLHEVVRFPTRWSDFWPLALLPTKWSYFLPPDVVGNSTTWMETKHCALYSYGEAV